MSKLLTPKITISAAMHFNPSENLIKNPVCFFFQLYCRCAFQSQLLIAFPGSHCFSGSVSIDWVSIDVAQFFWIGLDLPASWYWSIKSILWIQQFLKSMNHKIGWTIFFSRRKIWPKIMYVCPSIPDIQIWKYVVILGMVWLYILHQN